MTKNTKKETEIEQVLDDMDDLIRYKLNYHENPSFSDEEYCFF